MGACADALRELRGIRERLTTGEGHGLEDEQASVVRLVQNSPCPALSALASHVQHERLEQVLLAWRTLVVEGLEPNEPRLPKVAAIQAQSPGGVARVISTSETTVNGVAVAIGAPGVPMNPWIDHARRVVDVLIARVEQAAKAEPSDPPTVSVSPELLQRLEAGIAAVHSIGSNFDAGMARVFVGDEGDAKPTDPTMRDLASEAGISDDTFRRVRVAAGIKVTLKGAAARNRRYNPSEVDRLIAAALAGNFLERTAIAEKWARWGSKKAASKPHASK